MQRRFFRTLLHELDEAFFPSSIYCVCCGALIDRSRMYSLCDDCIGRFHWITGRTCEKCGKAMPPTSTGRFCYDCMQEEHYFRKGWSCLTYGLYERQLMMDLKYGGKGYLARVFGNVLFDRLEWEIREGFFAPDSSCGERARGTDAAGLEHVQGADVLRPEHARIDLIAPVPVSPGRLRKRGYNQAAIMARQLAGRWRECVESAGEGAAVTASAGCSDAVSAGMPEAAQPLYPAPECRSRLLYRTRETQMLRSLNPTERRMALQNAFAVTPAERERLAGKTVLLVDDIYTTGATADACGQALLEGGAADVYLLTLASGGNRKPATISDIDENADIANRDDC